MNQLIHTSPTLVLYQLGWGIPHAMWRNHAYGFYLDSITNSNGNTKFSLAWTGVIDKKQCYVLPVCTSLHFTSQSVGNKSLFLHTPYKEHNGSLKKLIRDDVPYSCPL